MELQHFHESKKKVQTLGEKKSWRGKLSVVHLYMSTGIRGELQFR